MKNKTSQPPIPDVDIIDLEAEEKTPDEIQEDFQEETEYEEAKRSGNPSVSICT